MTSRSATRRVNKTGEPHFRQREYRELRRLTRTPWWYVSANLTRIKEGWEVALMPKGY
jgi:hypothetical protein